jgi:hypothetical protein
MPYASWDALSGYSTHRILALVFPKTGDVCNVLMGQLMKAKDELEPEEIKAVASSEVMPQEERESHQIVKAARVTLGLGRADVVSKGQLDCHGYPACILRYYVFLNRAYQRAMQTLSPNPNA